MSGKEVQLIAAFTTDGRVAWAIRSGVVELISPGKRPTVRLYIEAEAGVTVDDCAQGEPPGERSARRRGSR